LLCSHISDHPQEELAKFGYKSERKVESFKIPSIVWWPIGTYCLNMALKKKLNPWKCGDFGAFLFTQFFLVWVALDVWWILIYFSNAYHIKYVVGFVIIHCCAKIRPDRFHNFFCITGLFFWSLGNGCQVGINKYSNMKCINW
jgi:hypothetical protein